MQIRVTPENFPIGSHQKTCEISEMQMHNYSCGFQDYTISYYSSQLTYLCKIILRIPTPLRIYVRLYYVSLPPYVCKIILRNPTPLWQCNVCNICNVCSVCNVCKVCNVCNVCKVCNVCNCVSCLSEGELKTRRRALLGTVGRVLHLT